MNSVDEIRSYLRLSDRIATSGMPQREHFAGMGQAGFDVVINLALPTSDNAIPNEGELVSAQGMTYIHLPVKFEAPQQEDFERFYRIMDACQNQRVFVHCAANMRVSAFLFLYRLRRRAVTRDAAEWDLRRIWEPDEVWRKFINQQLAEFSQPPLN